MHCVLRRIGNILNRHLTAELITQSMDYVVDSNNSTINISTGGRNQWRINSLIYIMYYLTINKFCFLPTEEEGRIESCTQVRISYILYLTFKSEDSNPIQPIYYFQTWKRVPLYQVFIKVHVHMY